MAFGERIKNLRKALALTQQEFADRIGTTRNNIAGYETGRREPSAAAINLIIAKLNVNETWLRTGEGEMFLPKPVDAIDELVQKFSLSNGDRILIQKFLDLNPAERQTVLNYVLSVAAEYSDNAVGATLAFAPVSIESPNLTMEQEVDQEVERYRQRLFTEKKQALQALSVKESGLA